MKNFRSENKFLRLPFGRVPRKLFATPNPSEGFLENFLQRLTLWKGSLKTFCNA